jgi:sulfopyruvate decarboxylase TPP-binding subunit
MITGSEFVSICRELRFTHVVWLPDSSLGTWDRELAEESSVRLVRVCREGEAWSLAAGLWIAGALPVVVIQNTGLFESGDAMRNALFDLRLPLAALVGYRSYLVPDSTDSARKFTEPWLQAWRLEYLLVDRSGQAPRLTDYWKNCRALDRPGIVLLAEGRG